jgi:mutator protein MutT
VKTIRVVGAAIVRNGRCLVAQRGLLQSQAGKWEFPGGKVEAGESPEVALQREITEELGVCITVGQLLGQSVTQLGEVNVDLAVYAAQSTSGEVSLREHARVVWALPDDLATFDWSAADVPIVAAVRDWLSEQA